MVMAETRDTWREKEHEEGNNLNGDVETKTGDEDE